MAAVKALARARVGLQHQSLLHLVGTRLRATTANSPLMIAGADLVAPSTSTRRPSQTKCCAANNWIAGRPCRRAVDGAARYDNPPLLCKCRRAPSTQVETGDLARVHRRMVSHTPMPSPPQRQAVPAGRIQLSRQFFRSCVVSIRQSSLQVAQQGFGNGKQPQINWQAISFSKTEYVDLASDTPV
jgi:hypothetical protein